MLPLSQVVKIAKWLLALSVIAQAKSLFQKGLVCSILMCIIFSPTTHSHSLSHVRVSLSRFILLLQPEYKIHGRRDLIYPIPLHPQQFKPYGKKQKRTQYIFIEYWMNIKCLTHINVCSLLSNWGGKYQFS